MRIRDHFQLFYKGLRGILISNQKGGCHGKISSAATYTEVNCNLGITTAEAGLVTTH